MKKIAIAFVIVFGLGLVLTACVSGRRGQRCPAYSKIEKTDINSDNERV